MAPELEFPLLVALSATDYFTLAKGMGSLPVAALSGGLVAGHFWVVDVAQLGLGQ